MVIAGPSFSVALPADYGLGFDTRSVYEPSRLANFAFFILYGESPTYKLEFCGRNAGHGVE